MGCGHSKINIYPKKARNKSNAKKSITSEKAESEEEECVENESELSEKLEECEQKKTIKVKPFGGPLLAQTEISSSQQNFFKMLDEKIENGPDYDSASESERAAEIARRNALLRDWETASAGSRSLPATPKRRPKARPDGGIRSAELPPRPERIYAPQLTQSVVHQSYGVTQVAAYRPGYAANPAVYPPALQAYHHAPSPMYASQPTYQAPSRHQYYQQQGYGSPPVKSYPPKNNNIPAYHSDPQQQVVVSYSPGHKLYGPIHPGANYTNGELIQQQMYSHQMQFQQSREYQQYKQNREQMLLQQQGYVGRGYANNIPVAVQSEHRNSYEPT